MTLAIPLPRPAGEPAPAAAPVAFSRSLAEIDRDLADLDVRESRHRDQLEGTRRALADVAVCRLRLLEQRARALTVAADQLAAAR